MSILSALANLITGSSPSGRDAMIDAENENQNAMARAERANWMNLRGFRPVLLGSDFQFCGPYYTTEFDQEATYQFMRAEWEAPVVPELRQGAV